MKRSLIPATAALALMTTTPARAQLEGLQVQGKWGLKTSESAFDDNPVIVGLTPGSRGVLGLRCMRKTRSFLWLIPSERFSSAASASAKARVDRGTIHDLDASVLDNTSVQIDAPLTLVREMGAGRELALRITVDGTSQEIKASLQGAKRVTDAVAKGCPTE